MRQGKHKIFPRLFALQQVMYGCDWVIFHWLIPICSRTMRSASIFQSCGLSSP